MLQTKPGACDPSRPVQLDVTGEADAQAQVDGVQAALSKQRGLDGGLKWDHARGVLLVRLVGPIDGSSAAVEAIKAAARAAAKDLRMEFQSVKYSRSELEALSEKLLPTQSDWAPGLPKAAGGWDADKNRVVLLVPVQSGKTAAWTDRVQALHDERLILQFYTPKTDPATEFQEQVSRIGDITPYYGGDWLSSEQEYATTTNAQCTSGFTWQLLGSLYRRGSTAYHCTGSTWFNNKILFGLDDVGSKAADTKLIRMPGNEYDYAPSVWVGSEGTTDARLVKGMQLDVTQGEAVAMSGAASGLRVGHVRDTSFYIPSINSYVVLMDHSQCKEGDSGAPVLTTMSRNQSYSGAAIAHGQHRGESFISGYEGCGWTSVNYIMGKINAIPMLAP